MRFYCECEPMSEFLENASEEERYFLHSAIYCPWCGHKLKPVEGGDVRCDEPEIETGQRQIINYAKALYRKYKEEVSNERDFEQQKSSGRYHHDSLSNNHRRD